MYVFKLFHRSDPLQPVAGRVIEQGRLRVGRDPTADWVVTDPDCEISRIHFELACVAGAATLRPLGTNGVFDQGGARLPEGHDVPLRAGDAFSFGQYLLLVDPEPYSEFARPSSGPTMVLAAPFGEQSEIPGRWSDGQSVARASADASLLDAFCRGADLDVSAFASEDPEEVMRRAGAIYRQMILGLGHLMSERSSTKVEHGMDRTTIGAKDNNPFKWAPTRRLATDLLLSRDAGFLAGADAVRASFEDVKKHLLGVLAGFHGAISALVRAAAPAEVDRRLEGQNSLLKSRDAQRWAEYVRLHEALARSAEAGDGEINRGFIAAYEERMRELERAGADQAPSASDI